MGPTSVSQPSRWSWSQLSKGSYPATPGKPRYLKDGKTCVLPVRLQPGKTYAIWVNSQRFRSFKDQDGQPAVPYLLVFETTKCRDEPTLRPCRMKFTPSLTRVERRKRRWAPVESLGL